MFTLLKHSLMLYSIKEKYANNSRWQQQLANAIQTFDASTIKLQENPTSNRRYLNLTVHATWKQKVCRVWEPSDCVDSLVVSGPRVEEFLRKETFRRGFGRSKVDAHIMRHVHKRSALVVNWLFDCNNQSIDQSINRLTSCSMLAQAN